MLHGLFPEELKYLYACMAAGKGDVGEIAFRAGCR
jgi:hypothetical protein